jgi:hypothetical protein
MSQVSSVGGLLYVMKWLRPNVSHANDVFRYVIDSSALVKWVLQRLRRTNVTYALRWSMIIVMYSLKVFWIGDLSLNMSHNIVVEDMLEVE